MKIIYLESLLFNNKPNETLKFIREKLNDEDKQIDIFDYFQAKAWYFLAN